MSLIKANGAGEQSTGFYKHLLDQSLKFDQNKSSSLARTPASAGNQRLWTFSAWVKKSTLDLDGYLLGVGTSSAPEFIKISNSSTDQFEYAYWNGSVYVYQVRATAELRDPSAWYHIVLAVDTAQGTAADRVKFYVNGTQLTDFSISTYPTQNADTRTNAAVDHRIGSGIGGAYYDGYIAEVNFIDGSALAPTSFGETKNGIWIPKDTSGLTFGTNGYHLTFKDDVVSEGFNTTVWRGTAADNSISGVGFSPAFVWIKDRTDATAHYLFDVNRGALKDLYSNLTNAEYSASQTLKSFDADGFTVGNNTGVNGSADDMVAWCWEGGGTPTATNSAGAGATPTAGSVKIDGSNLGSALAGTIPATKISANTARGFSIVGYEATGTAGTIAHGLSAAPEFIIVKHRDQAGTGWPVYFGDNTDVMYLGENYATADDANAWNDTSPTSTVFSVGPNGGDTNNSLGGSTIAYCFHSVSGYSKFGTWQNNNSTTGTQVTGLGFKPAFIIVKNTDNTERWFIQDNTRQPTNLAPPSGTFLVPNATSTEGQNGADTASIDFQDDGFQIKTTNPASGEISFGTRNYIYMAFADTREAAFFKDVTTNGNHFTPVNLDYRDSVPDVPTNNFNTTNVLSKGSYVTHSNGNLTVTGNTSSNNGNYLAFPRLTSGKYYYEQYINIVSYYPYFVFNVSSDTFYFSNGGTGWPATSNVRISSASAGGYTGLGASTGDIIGIAVDLDSGTKTVKIYKNNSLLETINITTSDAGIGMAEYNGSFSVYNFGQDSSFNGLKSTENSNADANGHGSFAYAPPSGYLALCSQNLPDVDIIDGTEHFNTVLWTGNATGRAISGVGFSPDFVWGKIRSNTYPHFLVNSVIGANKYLNTNSTDAETTTTGYYQSFDTDGFTIDGSGGINENTGSLVAWNWLAGTAFSNDASATSVGTIDSSGQVNTKAGFSIVSYTGTGSAGTIAHGLNSAPEMLIIKERNATSQWVVGHHNLDASAPFDKGLYLDDTRALYDDASNFNDTAPTSTVFSVGTGGYVNDSSNTYICYAFHSVAGYSKVGSFVGNGADDGPFVYTGFRPAWVMIKRTDTANDWHIMDDQRNPINVMDGLLFANLTTAETSDAAYNRDFLSNGFKIRGSEAYVNASGGTFIYLAFASQPFKFSNAF